MRFLIVITIMISQISTVSAEELSDVIQAVGMYYKEHPRPLSNDFKALSSVVTDEHVARYIPEGIHVHYKDSLTVLFCERLDGSIHIVGIFINLLNFLKGQ